MIRDNLFSGLGIGEGAWKKVYVDYSLPGIESAPHSHNLYMQISVEMGIFALIVFLVVLFLLYQSGLSFFSKLSKADDLQTAYFSETVKTGYSSDESAYLDTASSRKQKIKSSKLRLRMAVAGPLCGIFGVLVQGLTDYSWYNYRVYLMFWLIVGLAAAYVREGRTAVAEPVSHYECSDDGTSADVDLKIE